MRPEHALHFFRLSVNDGCYRLWQARLLEAYLISCTQPALHSDEDLSPGGRSTVIIHTYVRRVEQQFRPSESLVPHD